MSESRSVSLASDLQNEAVGMLEQSGIDAEATLGSAMLRSNPRTRLPIAAR